MAKVEFMARVSAIGGTSFTLTPILGEGTAGALVDGGMAAGNPQLSSGVTTVVYNSAGAPDSSVIKNTNQKVRVTIETEG